MCTARLPTMRVLATSVVEGVGIPGPRVPSSGHTQPPLDVTTHSPLGTHSLLVTPGSHHETNSPPLNRMTDTCESTTFPQLRWRTVNIHASFQLWRRRTLHLGPSHSQFGSHEQPAKTSKFFSLRKRNFWLTPMLKKFGYKWYCL